MLARSPSNPPPPPNIRRVGSIEIRPEELQVIVDGNRVGLTVREFEIFFVLAERFDRVIPREEIYHLVWGARMPRRDRSVDVFVRKVRGKLDTAGPGWTYIHTHFGIGYRFAPEEDAEPDNNGSRP